MRKVYCKDCGYLLNKWAYWKGNIRCGSCNNVFLFTGKKLTKKRVSPKGGLCHKWKGGRRTYYSKIARAIYYENYVFDIIFFLNVICEHCGTSEKIHIHHRDSNWKNNDIKNLQALCMGCHNKVHKKKRHYVH